MNNRAELYYLLSKIEEIRLLLHSILTMTKLEFNNRELPKYNEFLNVVDWPNYDEILIEVNKIDKLFNTTLETSSKLERYRELLTLPHSDEEELEYLGELFLLEKKVPQLEEQYEYLFQYCENLLKVGYV